MESVETNFKTQHIYFSKNSPDQVYKKHIEMVEMRIIHTSILLDDIHCQILIHRTGHV